MHSSKGQVCKEEKGEKTCQIAVAYVRHLTEIKITSFILMEKMIKVRFRRANMKMIRAEVKIIEDR